MIQYTYESIPSALKLTGKYNGKTLVAYMKPTIRKEDIKFFILSFESYFGVMK